MASRETSSGENLTAMNNDLMKGAFVLNLMKDLRNLGFDERLEQQKVSFFIKFKFDNLFDEPLEMALDQPLTCRRNKVSTQRIN